VEVADSAVGVLMEYRQLTTASAEAGGILLGRMLLQSPDVIVDEAVRPVATDRRSRFRFWRARRPAQRRIEAEWRTSGRMVNYLGEWHTHPEDTPWPSCHDVENWCRLGRKARYEQDFLIFLIVGTTATGAWEWSKSRSSVDLLGHFANPIPAAE